MANSGRDTETYHSSSLGPVNITSFDSMQEIAIHENSNSAIRHHRPATLPLEPSLSSSAHSDIINSSSILAAKHTPIDALKEWSMSTYKCTKQMLNEKLGKCDRTVDLELETEIEKLRDTQNKYDSILQLSRNMCNQYSIIILQQNAMYEHLNELAVRETKSLSSSDNYEKHNSLSSDFKMNAEMMRNIAKNGEKLLSALKFFTSNLHTLVYKTIEDTVVTIRAFEAARLEYDAERNNINNMVCTSGQANNSTTIITSDKVNQTKAKYEKLKDDVAVKMKFLDEHRVKVVQRQLVLFHNAFAAFHASGNVASLDSTLKQFSIRPQSASFLEKWRFFTDLYMTIPNVKPWSSLWGCPPANLETQTHSQRIKIICQLTSAVWHI